MDDDELKSNPLYKSVQDYLSRPHPKLPIRRYIPKSKVLQKVIILALLFMVIGLPTGSIVFGYNYPKLIKQALVSLHLIKITPVANSTLITPTPSQLICKNFVNLTDALNNINIACGLNLSGQGLTAVPAEVYRLNKLNDLNLSNNKLTSLPMAVLISFPVLYSLDLSNNHIASVSSQIQSATSYSVLQNLKLTGNNLSEEDRLKLKQLLPKTVISY